MLFDGCLATVVMVSNHFRINSGCLATVARQQVLITMVAVVAKSDMPNW